MLKNDILQWSGAIFVIVGHILNSLGPNAYPWNIVAFFIGTILFFIWTIRVNNRPQMMVNIVAMLVGIVGLAKAFG